MVDNNALFTRFCLALITALAYAAMAGAQPVQYSLQNAHAHNDYVHDSAFVQAFNHGFGSIEADVFPVDGELMLAHDRPQVRPTYTLSAVYLQPLKKHLQADGSRRVRLLVDIKENYPAALSILQQQLQPLKGLLSTPSKPNQLTVIVSGEKPIPQHFGQYPDYLFFDNHFDVAVPAETLQRVGMNSISFSKYYKWNGVDAPVADSLVRIRQLVDSAHATGKPFRLWGAPDTPLSWQLQQQLGTDFIGTDNIPALAEWLRKGR